MTDDVPPVRRTLQALAGDMVGDAETAIELAAVLIRRNYGEEALKAQQPLSAREVGEYWAIEGAPNAMEPSSGTGPVRIELKKADARIASLFFTLPSALRMKLRKGDAPS